jgi:hypothetical protein
LHTTKPKQLKLWPDRSSVISLFAMTILARAGYNLMGVHGGRIARQP